MSEKEFELLNEFHRLCHKACVGYNIHHDEACNTFDITVKSISMFERYHTSETKSLEVALNDAIKHLNKIAFPNHDKEIHLAM